MKKRIYDLTLRDLKNICQKHSTCKDCPIDEECNRFINGYFQNLDLRKLKREIEISKEIVGTITLENALLEACPDIKKKVEALEIIKKYADIIEQNDILNISAVISSYGETEKEEIKLLKEMIP